MNSVKPTNSYPHKHLVEFKSARTFHEHFTLYLVSVPAGDTKVTYTFLPPKDDPNLFFIRNVEIGPRIINAIDFKDEDLHTHYPVLYHVYAVLNLIKNFILADTPLVKYNDGWGTITIKHGEKEGNLSVSYLDKWERNIVINDPTSFYITDVFDKPLVELLIQIKNDGYKAQEEMLKRDGTLNKFIFHTYPTMSKLVELGPRTSPKI